MKHNAQEKSAKNHINAWRKSPYYDLHCVYKKYSVHKERAWKYCVDLCKKFDGENLRIISYNTNIFTVGFSYIDKETGIEMFCYITPSYEVAVKL